jgi:hypothetical protein
MRTPLIVAAGLAALSLAACGNNDEKTEAPMAADSSADASAMAPAGEGAMAPSDGAMAPSSGAMAPSSGAMAPSTGAMAPSDGSMTTPVPPAPERSASDTNDPATPPPAN